MPIASHSEFRIVSTEDFGMNSAVAWDAKLLPRFSLGPACRLKCLGSTVNVHTSGPTSGTTSQSTSFKMELQVAFQRS